MKMLIGGQKTDSSDGRTIDVINPANGKFLDTIPMATEEDVQRAVDNAKKGQKEWTAIPLMEREKIIQRFVRLLEEQLQAREQYLRRLSADIDEARRVREDVARELAAVDDLLQRQEAEQASRGLMKRSASWIRPASARASTRWSMPSSR